MSHDYVIDAVARDYAGFSLNDIEEREDADDNYCGYAIAFKRTATEMFNVYIGDRPTPQRLAGAKVILTDDFFAWRASVPKSHRNRIGAQGHKCIFHVFEEMYQKVRLVELTLAPGQLFAPPEPREVPSQPQGITLGEVMGEVE